MPLFSAYCAIVILNYTSEHTQRTQDLSTLVCLPPHSKFQYYYNRIGVVNPNFVEQSKEHVSFLALCASFFFDIWLLFQIFNNGCLPAVHTKSKLMVFFSASAVQKNSIYMRAGNRKSWLINRTNGFPNFNRKHLFWSVFLNGHIFWNCTGKKENTILFGVSVSVLHFAFNKAPNMTGEIGSTSF